MRLLARRFAIGFLPLSLLAIGLFGCPRPRGQNTGEQLLEASQAAGVEVRRNEVFSISRGAETFAAAPIAGWEQRPATELRDGIDIAFAYLDISEPRVPKGYYTIRAFANATGMGTTSARLEFIDRQGNTAAEIAGEAEIHSMTVPESARSQTSFIATRLGEGGLTQIWFRCPNGQCIRMPVFRQRNFRF